eukprot:TRINITY_DN224_c0_g2_i1.p1 TRINITY_DN224_c0_g2~~TRINITY_DN224_c0_g2_i1.p1  ORF type:complete len:392 (+),score=146.22 TRINITY_DN224_c0_g2_i1:52-1227(+)
MRAAPLFLLALGASALEVPLVTFDGAAATTHKFSQLNDPVMGGKSSGSWSVESGNGTAYGAMKGEVVDVPSLKAPGFITAASNGKYPDASPVLSGGLRLRVRSPAAYKGWRVSFAAGTLAPEYACAGGGSIPLSRGCFKAHFDVPAGDDFTDVYVPFNKFSDKWSPSTGEQTTTCAQDPDVCPTAKALAGILRMQVWAEGVDGKVELDVERIDAVLAPGVQETGVLGTQPPKQYEMCSGAVQKGLLYGISGRTTPAGVNAPVDQTESLAEAVCCDKRAELVAEPRFLYEAPDVQLFTKLDASGVTTFYDSVCGVPLFRAPVGRSFADFQADTAAHGWPSFRPAEVVQENVVTDRVNKLVKSKCGTHLGTFDPDAQGDRWCIDLSCVAGQQQ